METHQFSDLTLQVQDTVELPLAAALRCDAVLTPPPHVVDKLKLFRGQFVHFHQHLEVIPWKICDLIYRERQLHLEKGEKDRKMQVHYYSWWMEVAHMVNVKVNLSFVWSLTSATGIIFT